MTTGLDGSVEVGVSIRSIKAQHRPKERGGRLVTLGSRGSSGARSRNPGGVPAAKEWNAHLSASSGAGKK
jgi:hypothetical protein